ncbi:MAG: hypothetical protein HZC01_04125 [Candidatus Kerfeldbacteria bacterium]|nr:hypothetical protein [Candidatus Kerfeldbacteria bacterium]
MRKKIILGLGIVLLAVIVSGCTKTTTNTNSASTTNTTNSTNTTTNTGAADPEGTIVVDAGTGTLSGVEPSTIDFIQEISTGTVAYLGSKGATANYTVTAEQAGTYKLMVKLSDDGTWDNGFRDADIMVNGNAVLKYLHTSQDTRGWKWFTIGNASLKVGDNTVSFTKSNDMPAAYAMDEFKFVPVILI